MSRKFRVSGRGEVTVEELQTMIREYMAGNGPEPEFEGGADERVALMHLVETQGNAELQSEFGAYIAKQGWNNATPSRAGDNPTLPGNNRDLRR